MDLTSIILSIISRMDGERTIYAGLHLLRGKRSGQTLQDVEYYGLKPFFGVLPKLPTELYEDAASRLIHNGNCTTDADSIVSLTDKGRVNASTLPSYCFRGWDYRGRELIFFARLSLAVQTLSNFKSGEKSFMPIQRDREIQMFVKNLFFRQPIGDPSFSRTIGEEIRHCIDQCGMSNVQKTILTHRLGGYGLTGWTWDQLASSLKLNPISVRLLFIESLHMLLNEIEMSSSTPFLRKMTENVKVSSYLTESSLKTKYLFDQGKSIGEIAAIRKLKMSTIEDHFVEMSINDSNFPLTRFVSEINVDAVISKATELGTKRLRLLKSVFEELSYFQLRLILGAKTGGGTEWTSTIS